MQEDAAKDYDVDERNMMYTTHILFIASRRGA